MKKKKYRIYARDKEVVLDGLKTSKGTVNFGNQTAVYVDEKTAKEVDEKYGRKGEDSVLVANDEQYARALNGEGWEVVRDKNKGDWVKTIHKYTFEGVDTSHFKVWVMRGNKLTRVTKDEAKRKGYEIISTGKEKPKENVIRAHSAEVKNV